MTASHARSRAYTASLPGKRCSAGALFMDSRGQILLVNPTYKPYWDLLGGVVNEDESPRAAVVREVKEELGLDVLPGRLLVEDWFAPRPAATEGLMHVFDGGYLDKQATDRIQLQDEELCLWAWSTPAEVTERLIHAPELARRVAAAQLALRLGTTEYLESGHPVADQLSTPHVNTFNREANLSRFGCATDGCHRHPAAGDTIHRTSAKGEPFVGHCDEHLTADTDPVVDRITQALEAVPSTQGAA